MDEVTIPKELATSMLCWALNACHQGTGDHFGDPAWHRYITTWEEADDLLPRFANAIGADWFDKVFL